MTDPRHPNRAVTPFILEVAAVGKLTMARTELIEVKRALLFAAGIKETNPCLTDPSLPGGLKVHPGFAFCLQFNSQGRLGGPPPMPGVVYDSVHAETDLRIIRPLRVGSVVTTQGRIAARRQIASGVLNVERYAVIDEVGRHVLEIDFNLVFRGAKLDGPDADQAPRTSLPPRPESAGVAFEREIHITQEMLHHYTACSGIFSPIHTDIRAARAAGFADIILPGSAIKSMALSAIIDTCFEGDPERIRRLYGQLRGVVPAGTAMRVQVLAIRDMADARQVFFEVLNDQNALAVANGFVAGQRRQDEHG